MKLKVAVLDHDLEFLNRLAEAFQKKYEDKIILRMFSDEEAMYESLQRTRVDLILAEQSLKMDISRIASGTVVGCFCEMPDVGEVNGIPAICKFQKVENIYKEIFNIYADYSENIQIKTSNSETRIVLFTSAQGGSGTSTAAAAHALRKAQEGYKIVYLNLEQFGDTDLYFSGSGSMSFSDVIYALKSKNGNLELRLESIIQTDQSGVDFFHTCKNAYDMFELQSDEIETLVSAVSNVKKYDEIVIDISDSSMDRQIKLMKNIVDKIIYVSDGSMTGNKKFEQFCDVIRVLEQRNSFNVLEKMILLYNRYSSKTSKQLKKTAVPVLGGIHRFEGIGEKELIQKISQVEIIGEI